MRGGASVLRIALAALLVATGFGGPVRAQAVRKATTVPPPSRSMTMPSGDRRKYGNKAVRALRDAGWKVIPIHPTLDEVEGLAAYPSLDALPVARLDHLRVDFFPSFNNIRVL